MKWSVFLLMLCLTFGGCATVPSGVPPTVSMNIPQAFKNAVEVKKFKAGEDLWNSPPYEKICLTPTNRTSGAWGPQKYSDQRDHAWSVEVRQATTEKVASILDVITNAKDGDEAGRKVDETQSYMFARLARISFEWGTAFSYLTQYTQDTSAYVPHNGHLTYEVWGVTHDRRFVVHATFELTHPKLATWGPEVREADSMEALKRDRDYIRVESCQVSEFRPNLTDVNAMLNSLRIEEAEGNRG